jgi:hypothetical protein
MSRSGLELEGYEFLTNSINTKRLQTEAKKILDSYSHTWDILAESLQNSVDAIEENKKANPKSTALIQIVFDANLRSIEISDTGTGMSPSQVMEVLAPHHGYKRGKGYRGRKALGYLLSCS